MTAQQVLAAHITQCPDPITPRRTAASAWPRARWSLAVSRRSRPTARRAPRELHEQLELIATPSGGSVPTTAVATVVSRPPSRRWLAVALGLLGLIVVSGAGYWRLGRRAPLDRHRVLAPAFVNRTGDPTLDPLIANASAAVSSGLAEIQGVEVVEGESNRASAGTLVSAALYRQGDSIQRSASITDASSGTTVYAVGPLEAPVNRPREGDRAPRPTSSRRFSRPCWTPHWGPRVCCPPGRRGGRVPRISTGRLELLRRCRGLRIRPFRPGR